MRRRELLRALALPALAPLAARAAQPPRRLRAAATQVAAAGQPSLAVWAFDAQVPGPLLRLARGALLDVAIDNALPAPTAIHFHGVRMPNAMDGVPHLTQSPIGPGDSFRYRFALPDSGTFWYHPHAAAVEQIERGLYGPLIVEDEDPPAAEREWVWVLDDWRLDAAGRIADDFYAFMDVSHAGRLGNAITVNSVPAPEFEVEAGARVRLRLINAANARIFALRFPARTWLVMLDGAPLAAAEPLSLPLLLGPGMRADVLLDIDANAGARLPIVDVFGRGERELAALRATGGERVRAARPAPRVAAPNPLPEPDLRAAHRATLVIGGGMMSMEGWPRESFLERSARWMHRLAGARSATPSWTVNGAAHVTHAHAPEFTVARGATVVLRFENRTAWWHPMHLHGHSFRELRRNGEEVPQRPWRDTALVPPRQTLDIGFVADNPGDWLIHCHVLEHHAGGLGTTFRVRA
jgi:FtsP/CotA-like multicopper oxidase with cupredoxin domain